MLLDLPSNRSWLPARLLIKGAWLLVLSLSPRSETVAYTAVPLNAWSESNGGLPAPLPPVDLGPLGEGGMRGAWLPYEDVVRLLARCSFLEVLNISSKSL